MDNFRSTGVETPRPQESGTAGRAGLHGGIATLRATVAMHLSDFAAGYRLHADVKPITAADYLATAQAFERWAGGPLTLEALSAALLNRYLNALADLGRSKDTVASRRRKLLVLWRAAYRAGLTDNRPDVDRVLRIRVPTPNPLGIDAEGVRTLVAHCQSQYRRRLRLIPVAKGDYLAALFSFLWDADMRLLDATQFEFARLGPQIAWRQSKTGHWARARVTDKTLALIDRIREPARRLIFPRPARSRTALYKMIREAFAAAGLAGTSKFIRRGAATDVFLDDRDPAVALGHVPGSRVAYRNYIPQEAQLRVESPREL